MTDQHESLIKTPKQLIITVVIAFAVPIAIAVLASQMVTAVHKSPVAEETTAQLIQPVARLELGSGGAAAGARTGEQVVQTVCAACHQTGAAGAPKIGDKAAWSARIALGAEALTKSVIVGKGAMPPKGGGADLTDAEIARAVVLMANQSGATFKEPPAAAAVAAAAAPSPAPATAPATAPAPAPTVAAAAPAAAADGTKIYESSCAACHAQGVAGAPKTADKAAWAPRIGSGIDTLMNSVINGKGAMPARGGNPKLTNDEIKAAVDYMLAQAK